MRSRTHKLKKVSRSHKLKKVSRRQKQKKKMTKHIGGSVKIKSTTKPKLSPVAKKIRFFERLSQDNQNTGSIRRPMRQKKGNSVARGTAIPVGAARTSIYSVGRVVSEEAARHGATVVNPIYGELPTIPGETRAKSGLENPIYGEAATIPGATERVTPVRAAGTVRKKGTTGRVEAGLENPINGEATTIPGATRPAVVTTDPLEGDYDMPNGFQGGKLIREEMYESPAEKIREQTEKNKKWFVEKPANNNAWRKYGIKRNKRDTKENANLNAKIANIEAKRQKLRGDEANRQILRREIPELPPRKATSLRLPPSRALQISPIKATSLPTTQTTLGLGS